MLSDEFRAAADIEAETTITVGASMEIDKRDEMFDMISGMSDRQVDPAVKTRLATLRGRANADIKDELLGLIDDIVYCSWTSDFEIMVLETIWFGVGGSKEELSERNAQMNDPATRKALKERFKWKAAVK